MNTRQVFGCLLVLAAGPLHAGVDVAPGGKYEGMLCVAGPMPTIVQSDKEMAGTYESIGPIITKPGMLYHLTNIRCLASWSIVDGQYSETGHCQIVDNDGDKMFGRFSHTKGEGRWDVISGTGKYTGMTSGGAYGSVGQIPQPVAGSVQACNRITGTWRLR